MAFSINKRRYSSEANSFEWSTAALEVVNDAAKERGVRVIDIVGMGTLLHTSCMAVEHGRRGFSLTDVFLLSAALEIPTDVFFGKAFAIAAGKPGKSVRR